MPADPINGNAARPAQALSPPVLSEATQRLLPWLVAVAFFMESLDTTILNTAVPTIAGSAARGSAEHEIGVGQLHVEPGRFHSRSAAGWRTASARAGVFASAIGIFTLGIISLRHIDNIHLLVACRILQGCGGAMMVPVGRLTMVRTFAKSELVRAMSFVAIPGLIGPMLGPIAGGLIVGYFHWRLIFFVNIPIGLVGLYLVYKHLPDYRETYRSP